MGIDCGSQIILCDNPIRIDTYKGCSHGCNYCFVQRNADLRNPQPTRCVESLRRFINGERTLTTNWCDWDIPLHWGGVSDPFQPLEVKERASLECLEVFAETGYPFIVSTKGSAAIRPEYLELFAKSRCITQVSVVSPKYDNLEPGAPKFNKRVEMLGELSKVSLRTIVRVQPYIPDVLGDVLDAIPLYADAGVYGIILEGMKFMRKQPGTIKCAGDFVLPKERLVPDFIKIREKAHEHGLVFLCGENRLRAMGDDLNCCGAGGLFDCNTFNLSHLLNGDRVEPTEKMNEVGTAYCFHTLFQTSVSSRAVRRESFASKMVDCLGKDNMRKSLGF